MSGSDCFREDTFAPEGWALAGGAGRLVFGSAAGRWTVHIEPRLGDVSSSRVYLNLNFHKKSKDCRTGRRCCAPFSMCGRNRMTLRNAWTKGGYDDERNGYARGKPA